MIGVKNLQNFEYYLGLYVRNLVEKTKTGVCLISAATSTKIYKNVKVYVRIDSTGSTCVSSANL